MHVEGAGNGDHDARTSHSFGERAATQLDRYGLRIFVHDRVYAKAFWGAGGELQRHHVLTDHAPGFEVQWMAVDDRRIIGELRGWISRGSRGYVPTGADDDHSHQEIKR